MASAAPKRSRASRTSAGRRRAAADDRGTGRTRGRTRRSPGGASISAIWVGTPADAAMRCAATRRSASSARQRSTMMKSSRPARRLPGSLVMKPEVRERRAGEARGRRRPSVSPTSVWVMNASWRFRVQRALRRAGRARREDDRDRPVGVVGAAAAARSRRAKLGEHGVTGPRRRSPTVDDSAVDRPARGRARPTTSRARPRSSTASRSAGEPVVDAGGDRADLGRARRTRTGTRGRRQDQRDDVAVADTAARQPGRDLVGGAVEVARTRSAGRARVT